MHVPIQYDEYGGAESAPLVGIGLRLEWPMLWRITMNSLHNEGIYE